jgi:hypothetical protein
MPVSEVSEPSGPHAPTMPGRPSGTGRSPNPACHHRPVGSRWSSPGRRPDGPPPPGSVRRSCRRSGRRPESRRPQSKDCSLNLPVSPGPPRPGRPSASWRLKPCPMDSPHPRGHADPADRDSDPAPAAIDPHLVDPGPADLVLPELDYDRSALRGFPRLVEVVLAPAPIRP